MFRRYFFARTFGALIGAAFLPALAHERRLRELAHRLAALHEGEFVIFHVPGTPYYAQCCAAPHGLRVEAVSNHYLPPSARLSPRQHRALVAAGFSAPSHQPGHAARHPSGSPNYFADLPYPVPYERAAALLLAARDVMA